MRKLKCSLCPNSYRILANTAVFAVAPLKKITCWDCDEKLREHLEKELKIIESR